MPSSGITWFARIGCIAAACTVLICQEPPVLRVTTRLVEVNVIVTDKQGRPVEGLTKDDFTVVENGKPQKIERFSVEKMHVISPPAEALPPDVYTNRYELKGGAPSSATVILLDLLNTRVRDKAFARQELLKFLRGQLRPGDRVALYALDLQLHLLHDFTTDATQLIQRLDRFGTNAPASPDTHDLTAPDVPDLRWKALAETTMQADQILSDMNAVARVQRTAGALEAIARRVSALPGRKSLVWVTGGVPLWLGIQQRMMQDPTQRRKIAEKPSGANPSANLPDSRKMSSESDEMFADYPAAAKRIFTEETERVGRAMDAADLAVYPVDAQGLLGAQGISASERKSMAFERREKLGGTGLPDEFYANRDTMKILAERTGGQAFLDSNDLSGAIRAAVEDAQLTYVLSYYPKQERWDGHFQKLQVKVNRQDVTVRHRGGYLALPDTAVAANDRQAGLMQAATSPLESTGIRLVVATRPDMPSPGRLSVRIMLDVRDIAFTNKDGRWACKIDLAFVQQPTADGKRTTLVKDDLDITLTPEAYAKVVEEGLIVPKELSMASSAYRLKVVVRDANSGAVGSVEMPRGGK
ncbi:MAG: VWA domain-containing protein [Acidobacteriales bacterium]|nr:VWA domain-containing protein [Terriglobales bacterium]